MIEQFFQIIQTVATSPQCAIMVSLGFNVVLAWGWWRREILHSSRYDKLRSEWIEREKTFYESMTTRDRELNDLSREAFGAMSDTASALVGMERTLDSIEILLNTRLEKK